MMKVNFYGQVEGSHWPVGWAIPQRPLARTDRCSEVTCVSSEKEYCISEVGGFRKVTSGRYARFKKYLIENYLMAISTNRFEHITVSKAAEFLKCDPETISSLIKNGFLCASNLTPGSRKNNFRISFKSLEEFLEGNIFCQPPVADAKNWRIKSSSTVHGGDCLPEWLVSKKGN